MKHTRITAIFLVLTLIASALLTLGCGEDEEEEKLTVEGMWRGERVELDESFTPGKYLNYRDGKVFVLGSLKEDDKYCPSLAIYDSDGAEYQKLPLNTNVFYGLLLTDYGYIVELVDESGSSFHPDTLYTAFTDDAVLWQINTADIFKFATEYSRTVHSAVRNTDDGSELVIVHESQLAFVGTDGTVTAKLDLELRADNIICTNAGEIIIVGSSNKDNQPAAYKLNADNTLELCADERYTAVERSTILTSAAGDFGFMNNNGIYLSTPESGNAELLNFVSSGIYIKGYGLNFCITDEAEVYMLGANGIGGDHGFWRYTPVPEEELPKRTIIRIAYRENGLCLVQLAAIKFNQQQRDYYAMPVEYVSAGDHSSIAMARFDADVVSGKAGDIIWTNSYDNLVRYASKGVFADLKKYIDINDIFKCVVDYCTVDGIFAGIPLQYEVYGYLSKEDDPILDGGLTLSDFIEAGESGRRILSNMSRDVSKNLLKYALESCIDLERNTCDFTGLRELLEYLDTLPEKDSGALNSGNPYYSGKAALSYFRITALYSYAKKDYIFDGNGDFVGIPTMDGSRKYGMQSYDGFYGIASLSKNKKGAAKFLEFLMSDESRSDDSTIFASQHNCPVSKTTFDLMGEKNQSKYIYFYRDDLSRTSASSSPNSNRSEAGWQVELDETRLNEMKEFLDTAKISKPLPEKIIAIANDELDAFLAGVKGADETVRILESRIGTFLAERE